MFFLLLFVLTVDLSDHYHGEYLVGCNSTENFLNDRLKNTFFFFFCLHFAAAVVSHLSIVPSAAMPSLNYVTAASLIPCYKSIMPILKVYFACNQNIQYLHYTLCIQKNVLFAQNFPSFICIMLVVYK